VRLIHLPIRILLLRKTGQRYFHPCEKNKSVPFFTFFSSRHSRGCCALTRLSTALHVAPAAAETWLPRVIIEPKRFYAVRVDDNLGFVALLQVADVAGPGSQI
jgi:hypothetical protein